MPFLHGVKVVELTTGTRPIKEIATAVIGLLCTASAPAGAETDALDAAFPLDTPVLITDIRSAIAKAGTGGTLKQALEAISDQTGAIVVVVRVAIGVDAAATETNCIGASAGGAYSGMQAFLAAQAQLGVRPRIFGAPGLDTENVTTAFAIVARKLRGMVYAMAVGADVAAAVLYRANFGAREVMLLWPGFKSDYAGDTVARAMGLRARIDREVGWHKTLSNVAVDGVTGLAKDVFFDINGEDNDAFLLNQGDVTTMIRHEGYRFWGNRTCSDEPKFAFESAVRTAQVLQDEIAAGLFWAIDKPLTGVLIKDVIETINARFRRLVATGYLIGASAWFDPSLNTEVDLAAGKLTVDYDFTPAAPLEGLTLNQRITDRYYASFADLVV